MNICVVFLALASAVCSTSLLSGADLSQYREFQLGMPVAGAAKQTRIELSATQLISSRPERIEELDWRPGLSAASSAQPDSVKEIRFRFYNGKLFEMAVTYDQDRVAGLTDADMIQAISGVYGASTKPLSAEMNFNSGYKNNVKILAQWQDAQSLISLVRFPYESGFGLVVTSKPMEILARQALLESERLDHVEAPQRELALKATQLEEKRALDEKSRVINKPVFRP
jgi:hypothetical protein